MTKEEFKTILLSNLNGGKVPSDIADAALKVAKNFDKIDDLTKEDVADIPEFLRVQILERTKKNQELSELMKRSVAFAFGKHVLEQCNSKNEKPSRNRTGTNEKVCVVLNKELWKETRELASFLNVSKSSLVASALKQYLNKG